MTLRSPGVFNQEVDASLYVSGSSPSVAGMVGVASKGPIGVPTLVTNWPQFLESFGGFRTDSYLAYSAKAFFDEGGTSLYVVRTVHYTDITDASTYTAALATTTFTQSDEATPALRVDALNEGTWANGLKAEVSAVSQGTFTLSVLDVADNVLEVFKNLEVASAASRDFVENRVNGNSFYIKVTHLAGTPLSGTASLSGGTNGLSGLADIDFIGNSASRTGLEAFALVPSVRLLAIPGVTSTAVHDALATFAESTGTAFAVLGAPQAAATPTQAISHRDSVSGGYAALYWPWLKITDPQTGALTTVPPEGHVLGAYARSDNEAVWAAPAGLNRGTLRTALGVAYESTLGERDELYDKQVNVIVGFPGQGTVVWGQKTLVAKDSALDRVNVRRLLNLIKEAASNTSQFLLFEPNEEQTWSAFVRFIDPFLANIKIRRGLYDYRVVCDETTNTAYYLDRNQMVANIYIKPTKTAEFITIRYVVTASGTDFSEL
jgi:uncharacterized protein